MTNRLRLAAAALIGISAAAITAARTLTPRTVYCDVCGTEVCVWMTVLRNNEQGTRLNSITTTDSGVLAVVCPDCGWKVYRQIDDAVDTIIEQADTERNLTCAQRIKLLDVDWANGVDIATIFTALSEHYPVDASTVRKALRKLADEWWLTQDPETGRYQSTGRQRTRLRIHDRRSGQRQSV
jgi:hypothetical protein